jgi:hypothetical protein
VNASVDTPVHLVEMTSAAARAIPADPLAPRCQAFYDPNSGPHRGRDEIDHIAAKVRATHPDFQYQPISAPEEIGDGGRVRWVSGTPDKPPEYAGTDFIVARDGKTAALHMFLDELPSPRPGA